MKKLFYAFLLILIVFSVIVFGFIPSSIQISSVMVMPTSENGTSRFALDQKNWGKWWNYSSEKSINNNAITSLDEYTQNGDKYELTKQLYKSSEIAISHDNQHIESKLIIIPLSIDSTGIEWSCKLNSSLNPWTRIKQYYDATRIKKNMVNVLTHLNEFLKNDENIYGIHIERETTKDTTLVLKKEVFPIYPNTKNIYTTIDQLKQFAKKQNAEPTGNPIYRVTELTDHTYQLMCALPISHPIIETKQFSNISMVKGSFMVAEVIGGESTINEASKKLRQYFEDFHKVSMAVNFTMIVSDRLYETDSTKWISRLYYPVY